MAERTVRSLPSAERILQLDCECRKSGCWWRARMPCSRSYVRTTYRTPASSYVSSNALQTAGVVRKLHIPATANNEPTCCRLPTLPWSIYPSALYVGPGGAPLQDALPAAVRPLLGELCVPNDYHALMEVCFGIDDSSGAVASPSIVPEGVLVLVQAPMHVNGVSPAQQSPQQEYV